MLLYRTPCAAPTGPLLCGSNVAIKGLNLVHNGDRRNVNCLGNTRLDAETDGNVDDVLTCHFDNISKTEMQRR